MCLTVSLFVLRRKASVAVVAVEQTVTEEPLKEKQAESLNRSGDDAAPLSGRRSEKPGGA